MYLKIFRTYGILVGLAWLAHGSNGQFYGPDNGTLSNIWAPLKTGDPMGATMPLLDYGWRLLKSGRQSLHDSCSKTT